MRSIKEIGIISDTHGRLRPEAILALEGCELILHAGDVEGDCHLADLQEIAPTFAVAGNCDEDSDLPLFLYKEISSQRILMYHGHKRVDENQFNPTIVITGHTHIPKIESATGVLRINPGSAGKRRFNKPTTLARLTLNGANAQARIIDLLPAV